jgi:hypothetical protein
MSEPAAETDFERTRRLARERNARYRAKNLEKRRAWTRDYMARKREEDPEWVKANNDRYLEKYPERWKPRKHAYYLRNKEKWAPHAERYKAENPEKYRAAIENWRKRNPEKVKAAQSKSKSRPEAKARNSARQMRRHATKLNATPPWANHAIIQEIYDFANFMTRTTGEKWEVDHIYPLISDTICGLHCEFNLQVIPKSMNARKSNKWTHP